MKDYIFLQIYIRFLLPRTKGDMYLKRLKNNSLKWKHNLFSNLLIDKFQFHSKLSVTTFEVIIAPMVRLFCLPAMIISVTDVMAHEGDKVFTNRKRMIAYEENTVLIYIKQNSLPCLLKEENRSAESSWLSIWWLCLSWSRDYTFFIWKIQTVRSYNLNWGVNSFRRETSDTCL